MSEFDSELYVRVAFFAFLIRLGSGEFPIICNLSIRVKNSKNSQLVFWQWLQRYGIIKFYFIAFNKQTVETDRKILS